ncbi:MAG: hypothetical protein IJ285_06305 [Clostridia bacterium]|nr:hypothetical protein [Oscillospiraceae bacterium]MBQ7960812.1 hypothetical protein [Clostridia bacterium]
MSEIVKRYKKLAFYGVPEGDTVVFYRMKGFDDISTSKNPREYSRQYVDEEFEQTDVVGYNPSISFGFDRFSDDLVHEDLIRIFDNEKVGADAVRTIIMVDMADETKSAVKRDFAVIAENEGSGVEAYKYSGSFRVKGEKVFGTASSDDDWQTCTFLEG